MTSENVRYSELRTLSGRSVPRNKGKIYIHLTQSLDVSPNNYNESSIHHKFGQIYLTFDLEGTN